MKNEFIASFGEKDYVKAMRRASRLEEIERHGRQVEGRSQVFKSKKKYTRKSKYSACLDYD